MSQENVEIVRAVYERWGEGDFRGSLDMLDPHVVLVLGQEFGPDTGTGTYYGIEAVAAYTRSMLEPWAQFTQEAEEIVPAGDTVLVGVRQLAVGSTSGAPTELRYFTLWTFRSRRVIRIESFRERSQALEAAGLSEEAMSQENIEIVREAVVAMNRRDVDAFIACLHPDVDWVESGDVFPGLRGIYRGRAEVRRWAEEGVLEPWELFHIEIEEITEASNGRVFLDTSINARGRASGLESDLRFWQVFWFADGEVAKRQVFWNKAEALETAGLTE